MFYNQIQCLQMLTNNIQSVKQSYKFISLEAPRSMGLHGFALSGLLDEQPLPVVDPECNLSQEYDFVQNSNFKVSAMSPIRCAVASIRWVVHSSALWPLHFMAPWLNSQ